MLRSAFIWVLIICLMLVLTTESKAACPCNGSTSTGYFAKKPIRSFFAKVFSTNRCR